MKVISLSEEIEKLDKKDFTIKNNKKTATPIERNTYKNLPEVRKVALAKRRTKAVLLVALFVSCFSLSVFIGFMGPFLLFK